MLISTWSVVLALFILVFAIARGVPVVYALVFGSVLAPLFSLVPIGSIPPILVSGIQGMSPSMLRIFAAAVLIGVLVGSGSAQAIASQIVRLFGAAGAVGAFFSLSLSMFLLTLCGVFIDIAFITLAPIALLVAQDLRVSRFLLLIAMSGGGKAGNIISPNPNTIVVAENLGLSLSSLMLSNIIPALCGLVFTVVLVYVAHRLRRSQEALVPLPFSDSDSSLPLPSLPKAMVAPASAFLVLVFAPLVFSPLDPFFVLPLASILGCIVMGRLRSFFTYLKDGLTMIAPVILLMLGIGMLTGVIAYSHVAMDLLALITWLHVPLSFLAALSGIFMSMATGSTTAGAGISSSSIGTVLVHQEGFSPIAVGAMLHVGATVGDHFPQGSFFHSTAWAMHLPFGKRLLATLYETSIALSMTAVCAFLYIA